MENERGLSRQAYEPIPEGGSYEPYVRTREGVLEFTFKAVVPGILFGILFGAANAYLGLQAGLTISTSIPIAVMTVAAFRVLRVFNMRGTLLEANMSQTIGSASSSVASGVIFTLPALFMWGMAPKLLQMTLLALCGGLLGVLFMVPLRRFLIEREHGKLPYPEGTACAEVLVASEVGGGRATNVFLGLGAGALLKYVFGWLKVFPDKVTVPIVGAVRMELGVKMSAALFGVGYILGPRIASIMVGGGLLSSLLIIPAIAIWGAGRSEPFYPEAALLISAMKGGEIWDKYIRYIGAGAVATAGIFTLIRSVPTLLASFKIGAKQIRDRFGESDAAVPRTQRELPLRVVGFGALAIAGVLAFLPHVFGIDHFAIRAVAAVCVVIFAFFFVTVASRIVGLVGVTSNPTSGMTIASLIGTAAVFLIMGWTDSTGKAAALTVGCVVAIAASIAGDTSQDLKTGFLLGATPKKQQIGELVGVLTSAVFVCFTILLLNEAYKTDSGPGFGTDELPAPQATMMKLVIEGVLEAKLPWVLVGIGAGIAVITELLRIPSLPFAVGVYLPVSTMVPVFLGGMLRFVMERFTRSKQERDANRERGVLLGSGLVGGEGLMGVVIAGVVFFQSASAQFFGDRAVSAATQPAGDLATQPISRPTLPGQIGSDWVSPEFAFVPPLLGAAVFGLMIAAFAWRCRRRE